MTATPDLSKSEEPSADRIAALESALSEKDSRIFDLVVRRSALTNWLTDALEFIEDFADVKDGRDGRPRPNRAMSLAQEARRLLGRET